MGGSSTRGGAAGAERIAEHPALQVQQLGRVLSGLVATRSVNHRDPEAAMVERIERELDGTGCELTRVEVVPGRPSLAAVLPGRGDGPRLVLNGHMDTVSADDTERWSFDPFAGTVRDGAVWGRGAADMKGGLTAQIAVAHALASLPEPLSGTLVLHFAMGEERGEPGTLSLLEHGFTGDYGITTEPTDLAVATAQRGTAWFRFAIRGASAHAGTPDAGRNALTLLPDLLRALDRYGQSLAARTHPLFPPATCSPTIVSGGTEQNVIPADCELIVDRRLLPGESSEQTLADFCRLVAELNAGAPDDPFTVEPHLNPFEPAEIAADSPFVALVQDAVAAVTGERRPAVGTPYGSDVRNLVNDAGMEAITFGAGDVRLCHRPDERLPLADLRAASLVLARTALALLT
jgi:succinyl-diaminopimelate desuccinylase